MSWEAQSLRLTLFLVSPVDGEKTNWWERLIGLPPEGKVSKPRINGYEESGLVDEIVGNQVRLRILIQPMRMDLLLTASPKDDLNTEVPPVIGPVSESLDRFGSLARKWLAFSDMPQVERMAFGAHLDEMVPDRKAGYGQLRQYLSRYVKIDPEGSSDFSYSINRPRASASGIAELRVNRLSKWSVIIWSVMRHRISSASSEVFRDAERFSCHLELDISTNQDFREEIAREKLSFIYDELVALGMEIAKDGDIP